MNRKTWEELNAGNEKLLDSARMHFSFCKKCYVNYDGEPIAVCRRGKKMASFYNATAKMLQRAEEEGLE